MNHGSLFSGIGGFDLAAEWMGWNNSFHCEWNEFGRKVLNYYWPKAKSYEDITKVYFRCHRGQIDILTGGFPCQPYSQAGKRLGKEDDRHLWPEMLRAIREIKPRYVVGENVLGIVNWNGGLVFDEVQTDLEAEGYEVQPFVLPACAVNAPHRRDRVWFIAHSNGANSGNNKRTNRKKEREIRGGQAGDVFGELYGDGLTTNTDNPRANERMRDNRNGEKKNKKREGQPQFKLGENSKDVANTTSIRQPSKKHGQKESRRTSKTGFFNYWENFPTQSPICGGDDGLPTKLDGITFPKWRNESIKAYGNAIVPQVAFEIFKVIQTLENE